MWDAQSDPLGIALQDRARQRRLAYMNGDGFGHATTVLPSNAWDGFFQALDEAGVKKLGPVQSASPFGALPDTFDPEFQATANPGNSHNLASAALDGFKSATRKKSNGNS